MTEKEVTEFFLFLLYNINVYSAKKHEILLLWIMIFLLENVSC